MSNDHELVLARLMRDDAAWAERIKKKIGEVKKDKQNLMSAADKYSKQHEQEILEGTKKRQLLLSNGASRGMSEEDVMKNYGKFLPTVHTPILNMLYFMLKEDPDPEAEIIRKDFDDQFGRLTWEEELSDNVIEPRSMEEYIYGNCTLDTFQKIKKLKALSTSPNEKEAFLAYRMCLKLCKKYNLEFDKVPCDVG